MMLQMCSFMGRELARFCSQSPGVVAKMMTCWDPGDGSKHTLGAMMLQILLVRITGYVSNICDVSLSLTTCAMHYEAKCAWMQSEANVSTYETFTQCEYDAMS